MSVQYVDTRGRVVTESEGQPPGNGGPYSGYARMQDRNWSVQAFTGYPVSNTPAGNWYRGQIVRGTSVSFRPAMPVNMYDPTNNGITNADGSPGARGSH